MIYLSRFLFITVFLSIIVFSLPNQNLIRHKLAQQILNDDFKLIPDQTNTQPIIMPPPIGSPIRPPVIRYPRNPSRFRFIQLQDKVNHALGEIKNQVDKNKEFLKKNNNEQREIIKILKNEFTSFRSALNKHTNNKNPSFLETRASPIPIEGPPPYPSPEPCGCPRCPCTSHSILRAEEGLDMPPQPLIYDLQQDYPEIDDTPKSDDFRFQSIPNPPPPSENSGSNAGTLLEVPSENDTPPIPQFLPPIKQDIDDISKASTDAKIPKPLPIHPVYNPTQPTIRDVARPAGSPF